MVRRALPRLRAPFSLFLHAYLSFSSTASELPVPRTVS